MKNVIQHASAPDLSAGATGIGAGVYNVLADGVLNEFLAAVVGVVTLVILFQRWRINRRELKKGKD